MKIRYIKLYILNFLGLAKTSDIIEYLIDSNEYFPLSADLSYPFYRNFMCSTISQKFKLASKHHKKIHARLDGSSSLHKHLKDIHGDDYNSDTAVQMKFEFWRLFINELRGRGE